MTTQTAAPAAGAAATAFVPTPPPTRHAPPPAEIHPDRTLPWWRRMLPIVRAHRGLVVLGVGGSLVGMALQLAVPRLLRVAIDNAIAPAVPGLAGERRPITPYVAALVAVAVARFVVGFVQRFNVERTSYAIEYDLRTLIYRHLTTLSFSFFDRVQSGQLISRANSDIRSVQRFLALSPIVVVASLQFFVAFALMISVHLPLALVAVATLPGVYFTGVRMRNKLFPVSWIVASRQAEVATIVEENVAGIRVVKSFAAEPHQVRALARAAERLRWGAQLQIDIRAWFSPLLQNLPRLGLALVLLYGGWLAIDGQVTVGTLVEFNAYVVLLQAPFMMLGFLVMLSQRAAASADRIFEILDQQPAVTDRPGAVDLVEPRGDVVFDDVVFGYDTEGPPVLDRFSLHLRPGDTVALVGRTGSGKSTVARLIPRFYEVQDGSVRIDGTDVRDLTLVSLRAQVGLVLDEPFLFSESIRDNIAYGRPEASLEEVEAAARAAGVSEFVDKLPDGYDTVVGERGYTLSGGQRQRVAIARTLLLNPRVLILDDATSAVDVHLEHEIHAALRTLMEGRTTLVISHRLSTVGLAARVAFLEDGKVVAQGTHAELMATVPSYAEVLTRSDRSASGDDTEAPAGDGVVATPGRGGDGAGRRDGRVRGNGGGPPARPAGADARGGRH